MKPYRALLVENDTAVEKQLKRYLEAEPYKSVITIVKVCNTCSEAIDALIGGSFDLSILDINLPDGTCFDVIKKVRRDNFGEIVFFTHYGHNFVEELSDANPIGTIQKPFGAARIQQAVLKVDEVISKKSRAKYHRELNKNHTGTVIYVALEDIIYIRFDSNKEACIYYYMPSDKNATKPSEGISIQSLNSQFDHLNQKFVQCNKQCIINVDFLNECDKDGQGGLDAKLPYGGTLNITRTYIDKVLTQKGII